MTDQKIYVIAPTSRATRCKIGISADPAGRCRELQTGHPDPLRVYHVQFLDPDVPAPVMERIIHHEFSHRRLKGEWFAMTPGEAVSLVQWAIMAHAASFTPECPLPVDIFGNPLPGYGASSPSAGRARCAVSGPAPSAGTNVPGTRNASQRRSSRIGQRW